MSGDSDRSIDAIRQMAFPSREVYQIKAVDRDAGSEGREQSFRDMLDEKKKKSAPQEDTYNAVLESDDSGAALSEGDQFVLTQGRLPMPPSPVMDIRITATDTLSGDIRSNPPALDHHVAAASPLEQAPPASPSSPPLPPDEPPAPVEHVRVKA